MHFPWREWRRPGAAPGHRGGDRAYLARPV